MGKIILTGMLLLMISKVYCQINIVDSTAQVISYWDKNEKKTYSISYDKLEIQGNDTISRILIKYMVDITIQDSTENGYLINWSYRDQVVDSENELIKKLYSTIENIDIQIKTDNLGTFIEVDNWEDVRDYFIEIVSLLKDEFKDTPNIDAVIAQTENMYNSKQSIEAGAINDILQFHYFHGLKYKLWEEYSYNTKMTNTFGGEPFDAKVNFWLDEINIDNNNAVYRMYQSVDTVQLTNETIKYLTNMAETMKAPIPKREEFPYFHDETWIASRIHGSGWPLYSRKTKKVTADNLSQIEEYIIDLE